MESEELKTLVNRVINRKFESQTIELKKADGGCPKCRDTLSSFSNQDQGGTIIFGIDEEGNFNVNGVYDVADLEKRIQSQCAEMEPPVRAYFTEVEFKPGIFVVSAEIPACAYAKRPCYYLPAGRLGGSYVRVGEADEKMSEFEIYSYDAWHNRTREDLRVIKEASMINKGILYTKEDLYERLWGMEALGDSQTVVVHINRLREKIEKDPANPVHLINVRNGGYSFR